MNIASQIPGIVTNLQRRMFDFSAIGGGWLQFKTAEDQDGLRGEGIDFVVFDEAAHVPHMQDLWEQCVRPSLMDRKGDAWWISTPRGFNTFNTLFNRGRDKEPDWESFQFSSYDNPYLDPAEIDALKKDMPLLVARQEIDAEFVQLAGTLIKRDHVKVMDTEPAGIRWVRAWDLAFTVKNVSDRTASAKMGMDTHGRVIVADVTCDRLEWPEVVKLIATVAQQDGRGVRQGIEAVGAQVGAVQTLLRDVSLTHLIFEPRNVSKDKITRALPLVARAEQEKLWFVRGNWNKDCLDELTAFPTGQFDDRVDALTSGLNMLSEPTGAIDAKALAGIRLPKPEIRWDKPLRF